MTSSVGSPDLMTVEKKFVARCWHSSRQRAAAISLNPSTKASSGDPLLTRGDRRSSLFDDRSSPCPVGADPILTLLSAGNWQQFFQDSKDRSASALTGRTGKWVARKTTKIVDPAVARWPILEVNRLRPRCWESCSRLSEPPHGQCQRASNEGFGVTVYPFY